MHSITECREVLDTLGACVQCGTPAVIAKMAPMGHVWVPLCEVHRNYVIALSYGPQFMENASMPILSPEELYLTKGEIK